MMLAFSCMALRQPPRSALHGLSRSAVHGLGRCARHSLMTAAAGRKRVVFLGTPECAARSLIAQRGYCPDPTSKPPPSSTILVFGTVTSRQQQVLLLQSPETVWDRLKGRLVLHSQHY